MLGSSLLVAHACIMVYAQSTPNFIPRPLRKDWVPPSTPRFEPETPIKYGQALNTQRATPSVLRRQDWSHIRLQNEAQTSHLSNLNPTRLEGQTNFKPVQFLQSNENPFNSLQNSPWESEKGGILPHIIPSLAKFEPKSAHAASNWDDARSVIVSNLSPQTQGEEPEQMNYDDGLLQNQRPLLTTSQTLWENAKDVMVSQLKPDQDITEIDDDNLAEKLNLKNLLLPNNSPALAKSKQQSLTTWEDVQGRFTAGLALPSNPKLWKPPSYFQSLKELETAMANIKMHFSIDKNTPKTDPRYKYIAVVHVIEGLTQEVSQHGWDSYNNNYDALVFKLLENISKHPEETMAEINCVFESSIKKIQRIKKLMTNQWVDYLCKAQTCVCDTLVYAIVKMSDDEELNQEAELLLLLGLAATDYLDIYSRVFAAISTQNVYLYLKNSKEALRTLIYKNSIARRHSSFSLKDKCYAEHSLQKDLS